MLFLSAELVVIVVAYLVLGKVNLKHACLWRGCMFVLPQKQESTKIACLIMEDENSKKLEGYVEYYHILSLLLTVLASVAVKHSFSLSNKHIDVYILLYVLVSSFVLPYKHNRHVKYTLYMCVLSILVSAVLLAALDQRRILDHVNLANLYLSYIVNSVHSYERHRSHDFLSFRSFAFVLCAVVCLFIYMTSSSIIRYVHMFKINSKFTENNPLYKRGYFSQIGYLLASFSTVVCFLLNGLHASTCCCFGVCLGLEAVSIYYEVHSYNRFLFDMLAQFKDKQNEAYKSKCVEVFKSCIINAMQSASRWLVSLISLLLYLLVQFTYPDHPTSQLFTPVDRDALRVMSTHTRCISSREDDILYVIRGFGLKRGQEVLDLSSSEPFKMNSSFEMMRYCKGLLGDLLLSVLLLYWACKLALKVLYLVIVLLSDEDMQ